MRLFAEIESVIHVTQTNDLLKLLNYSFQLNCNHSISIYSGVFEDNYTSDDFVLSKAV